MYTVMFNLHISTFLIILFLIFKTPGIINHVPYGKIQAETSHLGCPSRTAEVEETEFLGQLKMFRLLRYTNI